MNIKSETKWRQNYYREVEKSIRYCEFVNQKAKVETHKITPEERTAIEKKLLVKPNPFALEIRHRKGKRNEK
ncbi:MAG: hypothetical protein ACI4I9_08855 [Porcipelethomonas sp.]